MGDQTPWWLAAVLVGSMFLAAAAVAGFWLALRAYKRRTEPEPGSTATGSRPPEARWQAGLWDTDPRHAYVANVGDGTAYEVSVAAFDEVVGRAQSVPPYRPDRLTSSAEVPCYVNLCIDRRAHDPDRFEVVVRWLAEGGEWLTDTVRSD